MKSIVYVGMDVHKESFTVCCFRIEDQKVLHTQKLEPDFRMVVKYLERVRKLYDTEVEFKCGYEAGCIGYTLYNNLTAVGIECVILAPSTMIIPNGKRRIKTDSRDAAAVACCLAYNTYSPVYVPSQQDSDVKEYMRMRDDHKLALKKVKQQINAFCLRHNYMYDGTKHTWTQAHMQWLRALKPGGLREEILTEYLITLENLTDKIARLDRRIEELASDKRYQEDVKKLTCFLGVKTITALATIVEISDFNRFAKAEQFSSYLGLVPGERSSGEKQTRLSITKAGNTHVRKLLVEAAQGYGRGRVGVKSKELLSRQAGNAPEVIAYADKANERLRRKYYKKVFNGGKPNVVKVAIARELACFIWGMMTGNISSKAK